MVTPPFFFSGDLRGLHPEPLQVEQEVPEVTTERGGDRGPEQLWAQGHVGSSQGNLNLAFSSGGYYGNYRLDTVSFNQLIATHLKIDDPYLSSTFVRYPNEL